MTDIQLGFFSHAHCFRCNYTAQFDKFEFRKNIIDKTENTEVLMELIQLRIICPICKDEHCEGLFPHDVN